MSASQKKELMEGYLGIKFRTIRGEGDYPPGFAELFPEFKECAGICNKYDMVPQNAGNFSVRIAGGMAITATGSNLALLEKDDIVFVSRCSMEDMKVEYIGVNEPSSETFLHHEIYQCRPDVTAIAHAHNIPESSKMVGIVKETIREEPYGTAAFAGLACETLGEKESIIVLKNHGYLAVGKSLREAVGLMIATHLKCFASK